MFKLKVNEFSKQNITSWREKVCTYLFCFLSIFGLFLFIPSVVFSIREKLWSVLITDILVYLILIFLSLNRKISYIIKGSLASSIFYLLGLLLFILLGPNGAGELWLFSSTIIAALLLGDIGGITGFLINLLTQIFLYTLLKNQQLQWQSDIIYPSNIWLIKSVNFMILNFIVVIVNAIYIRGFKQILSSITSSRNATIIGLAKLAEHRDNETGDHIHRIQDYTVMIAEQLRKTPEFSDYITDEYIEDLHISSLLHDIGKVGIGDAILLKEGLLNKEEFERVKQHPQIGYNVIKEIEEHIQGESIYAMGKEIALSHHEKWNGTGYPLGIKGDDIPLSARIIALADVYDALRSQRPYKKALNHEKSVQIIVEGKGKHFDPKIVDAFLKISELFR